MSLCIDLYFKIIHPDCCGYQKRMNNVSLDPLQKKSSQSEYHLNARYKHSSSFSNINSTTNYHLQYGRYSVCELNRKKSSFITNKQRKSTNFTYENTNNKPRDFHHRCNSERDKLNPKKYSLASNISASNCYNRGQPVHYVTCKRDSNQQKFVSQVSSSSTITTSNFTRSTMNTSSDGSVLIDQNKLIKPFANNIENSNCLYRK